MTTSTYVPLKEAALKNELRFAFANYSEVGYEVPNFVYEASDTPEPPYDLKVSVDDYDEVDDTDEALADIRKSGWSPVEFNGEYVLHCDPKDISDEIVEHVIANPGVYTLVEVTGVRAVITGKVYSVDGDDYEYDGYDEDIHDFGYILVTTAAPKVEKLTFSPMRPTRFSFTYGSMLEDADEQVEAPYVHSGLVYGYFAAHLRFGEETKQLVFKGQRGDLNAMLVG